MESLSADCLHYVYDFLTDRELVLLHVSSKALSDTLPNLRCVLPTLNYLAELKRRLVTYLRAVELLKSSTPYPESVSVSFKLTLLKTVVNAFTAQHYLNSVKCLVNLCFHQAVAHKIDVFTTPSNADYLVGTLPDRLALCRWYYPLQHDVSTTVTPAYKPGLVTPKGSRVWW